MFHSLSWLGDLRETVGWERSSARPHIHTEELRLPRGDDDGNSVSCDKHLTQASKYLIEPLRRWAAERAASAYISGNSFVYVQPGRPPAGPDFYVVWGGKFRQQKKWVAWEEEGRLPHLAVELLSPSTETIDRGQKFVLYRDEWKLPNYFLFDDEDGILEGFHLEKGHYVSSRPDAQGLHECRGLPFKLGVRAGWLRCFTAEGELIATDEERAELQAARAERLAARLRALGLDPEAEQN